MSPQLDEHNLFRIRTMSLNALQRRIYTIQRCDKLQSFIQVPVKKCTSVPGLSCDDEVPSALLAS